MGFRVVIPARYASQRLPGKLLLPVAGEPLLQHTCRRALLSRAEQVVIATDDQRIAKALKHTGADICMTHTDHQSGTDRIAQTAEIYAWSESDIIVNLQGDEPEMPVALINQVADCLMQTPTASMATLAVRITESDEIWDPNAVKVVTDRYGMALYFSRASIPWKRHEFAAPDQAEPDGMLRHLGIYAYRVDFLRRFVTWPPAPIEQYEALEQLRVLWQGERIAVDIADTAPPPGIDTEKDYQHLLHRFASKAFGTN